MWYVLLLQSILGKSWSRPPGLNTAHTHSRASEFLIVVEGTLESGFILENGLTTQVNATIPVSFELFFVCSHAKFRSNTQQPSILRVLSITNSTHNVNRPFLSVASTAKIQVRRRSRKTFSPWILVSSTAPLDSQTVLMVRTSRSLGP